MKIYNFLIVTTFCVAAVYSKGRIALRVQRAICNVHDPGALKVEVCSVKPINRTTTILNFAANITRPIESFMINSQLYKKSEIKYRPFLVNVTDDYCVFMSKKSGGAYLKIVAPIYMAHTNLNHTCPYFGYHYIKNLPIDEDKIPGVWPNGNYLLDIMFFEANGSKINKVITALLYFETKQRTIF